MANLSTQNRPPRFKVIDETADYIVVDKPAFLLAHPTKPATLVPIATAPANGAKDGEKVEARPAATPSV